MAKLQDLQKEAKKKGISIKKPGKRMDKNGKPVMINKTIKELETELKKSKTSKSEKTVKTKSRKTKVEKLPGGGYMKSDETTFYFSPTPFK